MRTIKLFKVLVLYILLLGHYNINAQVLKWRITKYTKLLTLTTPLSQTDFINKYKKYIDPKENVDSISLVVYYNWKCSVDKKEKISEVKIDKITKVTARKKLVEISRIVEYDNGAKYILKTRTTWIKIGMKWYKTPASPEVIEKKRIIK